MRHSKAKDALKELVESRALYHPTADEVYAKMREDNPKISLGTVYRNLNRMCEKGYIVKLESDGQCKYDFNAKEHLHCVCTHCGDIIDVDTSLFKSLKKLANDYNFEAQESQIVIYGICKKCKKEFLKKKGK